MLLSLPSRRRFSDLSEPEVLALAISSEEDDARIYATYAEQLRDNPQLWCKWSERYINWRQLEILGLMSKGNWA